MKLSARMEGLDEPGTLRFAQAAGLRRATGKRIISLGLGEPAFPTPPHIVEATAEAMRRGHTRYSAAPGLPELRAAVAERLARERGLDYGPDEILITPGAKNAIHLALGALLSAGDELLNIVPAYPSYEPLAQLAGPGVTVKRVRLTEPGYRLPLEAIAAAMTPRTRVVIYNSPHNPTGRVFGEREVRGLAEIIARSDAWLVSDEIYDSLSWGGVPHVSPATLPGMRERTVVVNGFSKAYAMTGWRIGYLAAPRDMVKALGRFHAQINTNTCTFVQHGALAALTGSHEHLERFNRDLRENARTLREALAAVPEIRCPAPEGGMFALMETGTTRLASEEFCVRLLDRTGVATTAGVVFGAENHVRVSLAASREDTREGVELMIGFMKEILGT